MATVIVKEITNNLMIIEQHGSQIHNKTMKKREGARISEGDK